MTPAPLLALENKLIIAFPVCVQRSIACCVVECSVMSRWMSLDLFLA